MVGMEESTGPFSRVPCSLRRGPRVLLINTSVRTRKVSRSVSSSAADDVCRRRDSYTSEACLKWLGADGKAICVQPPTGNLGSKARKRPVDCHIGSTLLFADSSRFCSLFIRRAGRERGEHERARRLLETGWTGSADERRGALQWASELTCERRHKRPAACRRTGLTV